MSLFIAGIEFLHKSRMEARRRKVRFCSSSHQFVNGNHVDLMSNGARSFCHEMQLKRIFSSSTGVI